MNLLILVTSCCTTVLSNCTACCTEYQDQCIAFSPVPSAPPQNVHGQSNSETMITVAWNTPPHESLNGVLRGYTIRYASVESMLEPLTTHLLPPGPTHYTINDLQPSTNYSIEVAAVTVDVGPYSSPVYITTESLRDGKILL